MSLLVKAGKYITVPILSEWLPPLCLWALDSALCNQIARKEIFSWILEYFELFVSLLTVDHVSILKLGDVGLWAAKRGYDLSRVVKFVDLTSKSGSLLSSKPDLFNECSAYASQIKHLYVSVYNGLPSVFDVLIAFQNVEVLSCRRAPIPVYHRLADLFSNLTTIDVSGCYDKISETAFCNILRSNPRMTNIDVSVCFIGIKFIAALIVHCRRLKCLNIRRCTSLSQLDCLLLSFHGRLRLESFACTGFETKDMSCLLHYQSWNDLSSLDFSESRKLNGNSLCYLNTSCPNITYLNLGDCARVDEVTLSAVAKLPNLRNCQLALIPLLSAQSVMNVGQFCCKLQKLVIYKTEIEFDCSELECLGSVCPSLEDLTLADMRSMTDDHLIAILKNCGRIKSLDISINRQMTDRTLQEGARYLGSLRELNISECRSLTSESLKALAMGTPKLSELNCVNCPLMSLASVSSLLASGVLNIRHNLNK